MKESKGEGLMDIDLTSPKDIEAVCRRFDFAFKKGLGQNFLTSRGVLEDICTAAGDADGIIEIGPGFGTLTRELCGRFEKVAAIELDERLTEILEYTLSDFDNVRVINADVLKTDLNKLIREEFSGMKVGIAANLPYYITTPIIVKLLEEKLPVSSIVVMVQREVAQRLAARPSQKGCGAISALCAYYAEVEEIAVVTADNFVPPPKVDSEVIAMRIRGCPPVEVSDEKMFFKTVRAAFSQRRKTALNCFSSFFGLEKNTVREIFEAVGIDSTRRGETFTMEELAAIANVLRKREKA